MVEYRTSESVGSGHPDKLCDRISDSLLDAVLAKDHTAKCAFEVMATPKGITISGETNSHVFWDELDGNDLFIHNVIRRVGYVPDTLYPGGDFPIRWEVGGQSSEIATAVVRSGSIQDLGAGDQGLMFGYADPTDHQFIPTQLRLSHQLAHNVVRYTGGLGPDAKTQVCLQREDDGELTFRKILISTMHPESTSVEQVRAHLEHNIRTWNADSSTRLSGILDAEIMINPSGEWHVGGPASDTGLTGRKIIVDTYGGAAPHGGGAFSGKDPSKVDRSAAYMARFLAKNIAQFSATSMYVRNPVLVSLSYSIGVREPFSFDVHLGHGFESTSSIVREAILKNVDLTPGGIIERLDLMRPIYEATSSYGHFGNGYLTKSDINEGSLTDRPWENIDPDLQHALENVF